MSDWIGYLIFFGGVLGLAVSVGIAMEIWLRNELARREGDDE